jgi:hypothetical protein
MNDKRTTRVIAALCLVGCLSLVSLVLWAQQAPQSGGLTPPPKPGGVAGAPVSPANSTPGSPLQVGEKLSFNVSWSNFVTAARMELELAGQGAFFGQEGYQLRTRVETVGYVRSLFAELDNEYTSYVDAKTLLPYRVQNTTRQGAESDDATIIVDQRAQTARHADGTESKLPASSFDLPAFVYALRARGLRPGERAKFSAFHGKKSFEIEAEAKERERIATQIGEYDAVRIELSAKGKDGPSYRVRLWLSADERRLPLLIVSKPSFGEVKAQLAQVSVASAPKVQLAPPESVLTESGPLVVSITPIGPGEAASDFERRLPFAVGERLSYDVSWLKLAAIGKVSFEVRQLGRLGKQRVFELVGEASSVGAVRSVVNLHDRFVSYAEAETLAPVKTETFIQEGKRRKQVVADYNRHDQSVRLTNGTHFTVQPRTLDLVSLFYAVRASDLKVGAAHIYHFLDANHRPQAVEIKVVKPEAISTAAGQRNALQLDILNRTTGQLVAQAWVSDDARRVPLYVVARLGFGEIRLQLSGTAGGK